MRTRFLRLSLAAGAAFCLIVAFMEPGGAAGAPGRKWYKGNLHTHTLNSDGDSTPHDVATWYRENRYNFLVLTDHDFLTEIDGLNAIHAAKEQFLLIPGEEVSSEFGEKPVHVNAFNPSVVVEPIVGSSMLDTIQRNVDAIRAVGGLPSVNHPNFGWAITAKELSEVRNLSLFEVYNGHPGVNNIGGGESESLDEMWDALLTAGRKIHGVAVDDAHQFKRFGRNLSNPGRGWVMVRAASLSREDILHALAAGEFYSSTGVELKDLAVTESELRLEIRRQGSTKHTTTFIGAGGVVLGKSLTGTAVYKFRGNEKYVRARVQASNGDIAWTQPVFPAE